MSPVAWRPVPFNGGLVAPVDHRARSRRTHNDHDHRATRDDDMAGMPRQYRADLMVLTGADHPWPGSPRNPASRLQGEPAHLLDATKAA